MTSRRRILYLGDVGEHTTSRHRAEALRRLGHEVVHLDPAGPIPRGRYWGAFNVRTGFRLMAPLVARHLRAGVGPARFDLAWIDGGPELPASSYPWLRERCARIVNYNVDDPFGTRDRRKWDQYLHGVRHHDLTVVVREENVPEAQSWGAKAVRRVYRSFDPVAHHPEAGRGAPGGPWESEVAFVGTWMPERGPLLAALVDAGIPLSIWGDWWSKASEWPRLQPCLRGRAVYGPAYVAAIAGARIAIGLLSRGNRDRHTTRSAEIPAIGGAVFCAERTDEHLYLLREGREALFWATPAELIAVLRHQLSRPGECRRIAAAAQERIHELGLSNDGVLARLLEDPVLRAAG